MGCVCQLFSFALFYFAYVDTWQFAIGGFTIEVLFPDLLF